MNTAGAATYKSLYAMTGTGDGAGPLGGFIDVGGTLYGATTYGGATGNGTLVSLDPATGAVTQLYNFAGGSDGFFPPGNLLKVGSLLYGVTQYGGAHGQGTLFSFDTATRKEAVLWSFAGAEGVAPSCSLIAVGGTIYGTASYGGANGKGTVFAFVPASGTVTPVYSFGASGDVANPASGLAQAGGLLYGTTAGGGANGVGAIYAVNAATGAESVVYSFAGGTDAAYPAAPLTAVSGKLYGTTEIGGTAGLGTVFSFDPASAKESVLHSFSGAADGDFPLGTLSYTKGVLYGGTLAGGAAGFGTVFSLTVKNHALTVLHAFTIAEGYGVYGAPLLLNDVLYGTTGFGGANAQGAIYSIDLKTGTLAVLHSFTGSTTIESFGLNVVGSTLYALASNGGASGIGAIATLATSTGKTKLLTDFTTAGAVVPNGSLASDGGLYGVSEYGGTAGCGGLGCGAIFSVAAKTGAQTIVFPFPAGLSTFCSVADLVDVAGTLYGTTCNGGANGVGSVFKFDPKTKAQATLYSFGTGTDGSVPYAPLIALKGNLYGTATSGGTNGEGTIFSISLTTSKETVLYNFSGSAQSPGNGDAALPYSGLINVGGTLYGTSFWGGAAGWGTVYSFNPSTRALKVLHSFNPNGTDGVQPGGNLVYLNGLLYGMTIYGGSGGAGCAYNACGTVFSVDPASGTETVLHAFTGGADGGNPPYAPLVTVGGVLYGTTGSAGAHGLGTVFSLTP